MRRQDKMPARNKKNFRPTEKGAGMTRAGVAAYRRKNPGSKLKTAVTGKVKKGSKAANRRKSYFHSNHIIVRIMMLTLFLRIRNM